MEQRKLWFKAKQYGWGWVPSSWQGFVIILFFLLSIAIDALHAVSVTEKASGGAGMFLWNYLPPLFFLSIILIWICYKTGEKPEWRWKGRGIFK